MVHVVNQIIELGPMYYHQMWTYEMFMSILNGYMRNTANPEGSMMEAYHTKEHVDCCMDLLTTKIGTGRADRSDWCLRAVLPVWTM